MKKILRVLLVLTVVLPLNFVISKDLDSLYGPIYQREQTHRITIDLPNTVFIKNSAKISPSYYFRLNVMANSLIQQSQKQIAIYSAGTKNLALARSKEAKKYFITRGVQTHRIHVYATFKTIKITPIHVSKPKHAKKANRHVELTTKNEAKWIINKHGHIVDIDIIDVLFEFDKTVVNPKYYGDLNAVVEFLKQDKHNRAKLYGHTDSVGADSYNLKLSQHRAISIKKYLVARGVSPHHIFTKGFGEHNPIASNKTGKGQALNRRVHVKVVSQDKQPQKATYPVRKIIPQKSVQNSGLSYVPRLYLAGFGGYDDWTALGQGDLLAPVFQRDTSNLFLYGQGRYSYENSTWADNPWTSSAGLGYRQMVKNTIVLGAYVLGDYSKTPAGHEATMVSPGLEALTRAWDFRVNGYIPVGKTDWTSTYWADEVGDYRFLKLDEHTRLDGRYIYHEEVGPGVDAEVGRILFKARNVLVRGFAEGYYYNMQHNEDIYGGGVRVTVQPTTYLKLYVRGTYDNVNKEAVMAGAQVSLHDLFSRKSKIVDANNLQNRLFEPIERNFATIGSASTARETGGPNDYHAKPEIDPTPRPETYDAWYFADVPATNVNDMKPGDPGTPENPYLSADFTQETLQHINEYSSEHNYVRAFLYFKPGVYNHFNYATIYDNFSLIGAVDNWEKPAADNDRPLFDGSFTLGNGDALENIRMGYTALPSSNGYIAAINIKDSNDIILSNVTIGNKDGSNSYATGIKMDNSSLTVNNSHIYACRKGEATADDQINATGIEMINGGSLTVTGSTVKGEADASGNHNEIGNGYGIHVDGHTTSKEEQISITNGSEIIGVGRSANGLYSANGYGILVGYNYTSDENPTTRKNYSIHDNNLIISDSTLKGTGEITGAAVGTKGSGNGYGLLIGYGNVNVQHDTSMYLNIHNNHLHISNSNFDGNGTGGANADYSGNGYGLLVGYGYSDSAASVHQPVQENIVTISGDNTTFTGIGTANGNYSGNGYGLLIGYGFTQAAGAGTLHQSVYGNQLTATGGTFSGSGTIEDANKNSSGNGYGLLVGYGAALASKGIVYQKIYDNTLIISEATFGAHGNAVAGGENKSANGYGLLVGYGRAYASIGGDNITVNSYQSISNNSLDIYGNTFNVSGTGNVGGDNQSANGYGLLVGYGALEFNGGQNQGCYINIQQFITGGNEVNIIDDNTFDVTGSDINSSKSNNAYGVLFGTSASDINSRWLEGSVNQSISNINAELVDNIFDNITGEGVGDYSGNAYGIFVGHGYFSMDTTYPRGPINKVISNNELYIAGGIYNVTGNSNGSNSGNGYGVLVGDGYETSVATTIEFDHSINGNTINIFGGNYTIKGIGNGDEYTGAAYGVLIGYNRTVIKWDVPYNSNTININKDSNYSTIFDIESDSFNSYVAGVSLGRYANKGSGNSANISGSDFKLTTRGNTNEAWGIWMGNGLGSLNSDALSSNFFHPYQGGYGGKIHWSDGHMDPWN